MTQPPGNPVYAVPWTEAARVFKSLILGNHLSFRHFAQKTISNLHPPLLVQGTEYIPVTGPRLIVVNHYFREGFPTYWLAIAISAVVPLDLHWIMAANWTYPGKFLGREKEKATHWFFQRLARVFDFTPMPPMPPRPSEVNERVSAVRKVLTYIKEHPQTVIGLAPEGRNPIFSKSIEMPAPGVGRFIFQLQKTGIDLVPAGVFELDGKLHVNFGPSFSFRNLTAGSAEQRDLAVRQEVMRCIARLLPLQLRGEFS